MQVDLEAANGASICADYFFPPDHQGKDGVTALAVCASQSQFLAGHVVDPKGASADNPVKLVLCDLRKMGHHGDVKVRMDQESALSDLFRAVAREGVSSDCPDPRRPERLQRERSSRKGSTIY